MDEFILTGFNSEGNPLYIQDGVSKSRCVTPYRSLASIWTSESEARRACREINQYMGMTCARNRFCIQRTDAQPIDSIQIIEIPTWVQQKGDYEQQPAYRIVESLGVGSITWDGLFSTPRAAALYVTHTYPHVDVQSLVKRFKRDPNWRQINLPPPSTKKVSS